MQSVEGVDKVIGYLENKNKSKIALDSVDHLFLSYVNTFKKFPPRKQAILKIKLASLFAHAEIGQLNADTVPVSSPYYSGSSTGFMLQDCLGSIDTDFLEDLPNINRDEATELNSLNSANVDASSCVEASSSVDISSSVLPTVVEAHSLACSLHSGDNVMNFKREVNDYNEDVHASFDSGKQSKRQREDTVHRELLSEEDEDKQLLLSILPHLRSLPEPQKTYFRTKLSNLLHEMGSSTSEKRHEGDKSNMCQGTSILPVIQNIKSEN